MADLEKFNYFVVIIGVIIGMALTQILSSWAEMIHHRNKIRVYWVHMAWGLLLFLQLIQFWYVLLLRPELGDSFVRYLFETLFPITVYMGAALLMPKIEIEVDHAGAEGSFKILDMENHYYYNRQWFFAICFVGVFLNWLRDFTLDNTLLLDPENFPRYFGLCLFMMLIASSNRLLHAMLTALATVALVISIVLFTA